MKLAQWPLLLRTAKQESSVIFKVLNEDSK